MRALHHGIPVLIMLPPSGASRAEQWVAQGRTVAALDLTSQFAALGDVATISLIAGEAEDRAALQALGATLVQEAETPFHFGRTLVRFLVKTGITRLAYFGGASAPLVGLDALGEVFREVLGSEEPTAVVNNLYSTDWAVLNHAQRLVPSAERFPTDNPLGWVMERELGFRVRALEPSAASRADIDTPSDLLLLNRHHGLGPHLAQFLSSAPDEATRRVERLRQVLRTPGKTLTVIGRSSAHVWAALERRTQVWTRFFVEERGMLASGRMDRGEVRTLIGELVELWGAEEFVSRLSAMSDAALWDTRVWMAHRGTWPSPADRFAADLGLVDDVQDAALRTLTRAIRGATIPILAGGHGVVSGGLLALLAALPD